MADTKQNQDDLIILSDDLDTDTGDMVINLDEEEKAGDDMILTFDDEPATAESKPEVDTPTDDKKSEEMESSEDLFSFDQEDNTTSQETPTPDKTENTQEEVSSDGDFNFDLSVDEETPVISEEKVEEEKVPEVESLVDTLETTQDEDNFGLDLSASVDAHPEQNPALDTTVVTPMAPVGTMESILDETILKLENRQDIIASEEEKESEHISVLEERIASLEKEKQKALDKKSDLESENKQIKENITALEKMKKYDEVKKPTKK